MRIISGEKKGMLIQAPTGTEARPTLDRVKEAIFGSIQFHVSGKSVLDLFAGSGSLGLEALSRGADFAVFCDSSRKSLLTVAANVDRLGYANKSELLPLDYRNALIRLKERCATFDIVFLDPPYETEYLKDAISIIIELELLSVSGIIIAEHSSKYAVDMPKGLVEFRKTQRYGETAVTIYEKA